MALRERFTTNSSQSYPDLSVQLEFLSLVVEDQLTLVFKSTILAAK
jgi:hypothetical protein